MFSTILHNLRGILILLILGAYTIVLVGLLMVVTVGKLLSPPGGVRNTFNRIAAGLVELWIGLNNRLFALNRGTRWDIEVPASLSTVIVRIRVRWPLPGSGFHLHEPVLLTLGCGCEGGSVGLWLPSLPRIQKF